MITTGGLHEQDHRLSQVINGKLIWIGIHIVNENLENIFRILDLLILHNFPPPSNEVVKKSYHIWSPRFGHEGEVFKEGKGVIYGRTFEAVNEHVFKGLVVGFDEFERTAEQRSAHDILEVD